MKQRATIILTVILTFLAWEAMGYVASKVENWIEDRQIEQPDL